MKLSYTLDTAEIQKAIDEAAEKELRAQKKKVPRAVRVAMSNALQDIVEKEVAKATETLRLNVQSLIAQWPDDIPQRIEQEFARIAQESEHEVLSLDQKIADQVESRAGHIQRNVLYTLLSSGFEQTDPETGETHQGTFLDHLARHMK